MNVADTLAKADSSMVFSKPFLHCVVPDALDESTYQQLDSEFPLSYFQNEDTSFRVHRCGIDSVKPASAAWQNFFKYHSSQEFRDKLFKLFEPNLPQHILDQYHSSSKQPLKKIETHMAFVTNGNSNIRLHKPHIDNANNLFVGLFYMRSKSDTSTGGDFEIYSSEVNDVEFSGVREANIDQVRIEKIVPYRPNTAVWMFTGKDAIHGASPRIDATELRKYVTINTRIRDKTHPY